jgi:hydrogenase maturation protease
VVGVGNAYRGDDALGLVVAQELTGRLSPCVTILTRAGDMASLIEDWAEHEALVIVDATEPMGTPGRIHRVDLATEELPRGLSLTSSHAFGITEAIDLARVLGRLPEQVVVYAVEGRCFDNGAPLSPEVAAAMGEVTERVAAETARLQQASADAEVTQAALS